MSFKRKSYHHGDLRAALITAAASIIAEQGIEGFSLRQAARRAGVAASAPAHHFGSAKGLLTEVALLGYEQLGDYLSRVEAIGGVRAELTATSIAYVGFALDHPGLFRLMFRNDLVDREDPRYREISTSALTPFARLATVYGDQQKLDPAESIFAVWSMIHGMAHLMVEEKLNPIFGSSTSRALFEQHLPTLVAAVWKAGFEEQ